MAQRLRSFWGLGDGTTISKGFCDFCGESWQFETSRIAKDVRLELQCSWSFCIESSLIICAAKDNICVL